HPALGFALEPGGGEAKAATALIQIQFFRTVIVGEINVRPAIAVEISRRGSERPPRAADSHLVRYILELPTAHVVEEKILASVGGELEAVVHDLRRRQVPQIDVASKVRRHVEVEQSVAIVVEPDGAVAVHPAMKARADGDIDEMRAIHILVQCEVAVPINQNILSAVVV